MLLCCMSGVGGPGLFHYLKLSGSPSISYILTQNYTISYSYLFLLCHHASGCVARVGLNTGIMRCQLAWVIFHTSSDQKKEFSEGRINCLRDHVITLGVYMTLPSYDPSFCKIWLRDTDLAHPSFHSFPRNRA